MTDLDELRERVIRLEADVARLTMRVAMGEDRIEQAIDAPPYKQKVVPPNVIGAAAALGAEIAESQRLNRSARDSAQGLKRAVAPDEITAQHKIEEPFKHDKKPHR